MCLGNRCRNRNSDSEAGMLSSEKFVFLCGLLLGGLVLLVIFGEQKIPRAGMKEAHTEIKLHFGMVQVVFCFRLYSRNG